MVARATNTAVGGKDAVPSEARNSPSTMMIRVNEVMETTTSGTIASKKSMPSRSTGEPNR